MTKSLFIWLAAILVATFAAGVASTWTVRAIARRVGFVAKPRAERWHRKPTALAGGAAIFAVFLGASLFIGGSRGSLGTLMVGGAAMFALGFADDVVHMKPHTKLTGQVVIAALAVLTGPVLPWTTIPVVNQAISFFWVIGITNAINLLDNMDGLAAGVACIAASFQAVFFVLTHQSTEAAYAAALSGALLGFLWFNWNPASIFMGDCGALFLGFVLASLAMENSYGRSRGLLAAIAAPVLVMLVPIFDTTFVTLVRSVRGRPISQGGRDHTSHRLVTLGLSERTAVGGLLLLGILGGTTSVLARVGIKAGVWIGAPLLAFALLFLGLHLARTDQPVNTDDRVSLLSSLAAFGYRRRIFEVVLDAALAMTAFVAAFLLRFDGDIPPPIQGAVARVFPIVVAVKILTLYLMRSYDGLWRYAGVRELIRLGRAAVVASVGLIVVLGLWTQFRSLSRGALIIDGIVFSFLLMASRASFRLLRILIAPRPTAGPASGTRVLLWGAGDLGERIALTLAERFDDGLVPVGFIDDDRSKHGRVIHGLPVHGDSKAIAGLLANGVADVVIVTSPRILSARVSSVVGEVGTGRVRRVRLQLESVVERELVVEGTS